MLPPIINGKNALNIYKFNFENFTLKKEKDIYFEMGKGNFRGAANIQIMNNKLSIVTSSMYLDLFTKIFI